MTSHYNNPNDMFAAQNGMAKEMHSEKMGTRMAYNQVDILKYNNQQLAEQLPYLSPGEKNMKVENTQYMPHHSGIPAFRNFYRSAMHQFTASLRDNAETDILNQPLDRKIDPLVRFKLLKDINTVLQEPISFVRGGANSTNNLINMAKQMQEFMMYLMDFGQKYASDVQFKL